MAVRYGLIRLLVTCLLISSCLGVLISKRHSRVLSAGKADKEKFTLKKLALVAYKELLGIKKFWPELENPFADEPICDPKAEFRTIDGTCNNLRRPFLGASKTPLNRLVEGNEYEDGRNLPTLTAFTSKVPLKPARTVSLNVHLTNSDLSTRHSHLLVIFGQFTDHDISLSPEAEPEDEEGTDIKEKCCEVEEKFWVLKLKDCFPLYTLNDPVFTRECIPFLRSSPTPGFPGSPVERFQLNDLTAFIDASQIYGSTNEVAKTLRTFRNGRLRASRGLDNQERLPLSDDNPPNCFDTEEECTFLAGDIRNSEQAGLTSVHTLFLREHNRIATEIRRLNPGFNDERLYQVSRRILGAILQRITYREFLPEVVGPVLMDRLNLTLFEDGVRFTDYRRGINPSVLNEFSTAAFRFGHSLIRQTFATGFGPSPVTPITDVFSAFRTLATAGETGVAGGLAAVNMEGKDRFITEGLRDRLFNEELDLPAFNIQRGRDHGLASYNAVRRALNLPTFTRFSDMIGETHTRSAVRALERVYDSPEDLELFPAGLSEIPQRNSLVGRTFARLIARQFRRLKFGDRFWHETDDPVTGFTDAQLAEIRKVSMAGLYCENVPGAPVRPFMLLDDNESGNSQTSCSNIPQMDFEPWRE